MVNKFIASVAEDALEIVLVIIASFAITVWYFGMQTDPHVITTYAMGLAIAYQALVFLVAYVGRKKEAFAEGSKVVYLMAATIIGQLVF